jgi:hypothetical protein
LVFKTLDPDPIRIRENAGSGSLSNEYGSETLLTAGVLDSDLQVFGPHGFESVIICTDPDPSIIKQKSKKNFDFYCFVTSS